MVYGFMVMRGGELGRLSAAPTQSRAGERVGQVQLGLSFDPCKSSLQRVLTPLPFQHGNFPFAYLIPAKACFSFTSVKRTPSS